jgi:nucleoside-diphosphate-sugar epimerase
MGKAALVTGGNGITGGAILEYLAKNTTAEQWSKIIVTSRSPFKTTVQDPRITFIALDFSESPDVLAKKMQSECAQVTHTYFSSYVHKDDFAELNVANRALFENFLRALLKVAPLLENCTLQTGGKHYNVHLGPVNSPAREEDERRTASIDNFYFPQEDFMTAMQKGQKWTWNVIRPEAIIGWTSKPNGMNSAMTFALYFIICKELGTEAPMPTNQPYWEGYDDVSYASLIADLTIFVSTHPRCGNEAFNVANGDYFTWRYMWPRLAAYFGASASSDQKFTKARPSEGQVQLDTSFSEWAKDKREVWDKICDKAGLPAAKATFDSGTWGFQDWVFQRTWCATLSINKARRYGWTGHIDSYQAFVDTFQKFKDLGQIPK